jgi:hypothetical protein
MTSEWMTKPELRGPMTGLISGFNILAEMLVAAKVIDPQALAGHLQTKIEEFREPLYQVPLIPTLAGDSQAAETMIHQCKPLGDFHGGCSSGSGGLRR